ncbi:MAG: DM13 domain-containing protein [Pseudomonadota bacterium]
MYRLSSFAFATMPMTAAAAIAILGTGPGLPGAAAAQEAATEALPSGTFSGSKGHKSSGGASIVRLTDGRHALKLEEDFRVTNGPDLRVYLSAAPDPRSRTDVEGANYVDLGELMSAKGDQLYPIPEGVDLAGVNSAVIWCRAFSVFFSAAPLQ